MKRNALPLLSLGLASLLLGACSSPTGAYASHWNPESVGERLEYHFLGVPPQSGIGIVEHTVQESDAIILTIRRHILNDNPTNPLQTHPYEPGDAYIPILHGPLYAGYDLYEIAYTSVVAGWRGLVAFGLTPVYLIAGTSWAESAVQEPPRPEEFETDLGDEGLFE